MSYAQIDAVIEAWAQRHRLTLYTRYEGQPDSDFRAVYLSSQNGECCQIWVDEPSAGLVAVHMQDIETRDDEEIRKDWSVPILELEGALEDAVAFTRAWLQR
jgi:hypothetical protein